MMCCSSPAPACCSGGFSSWTERSPHTGSNKMGYDAAGHGMAPYGDDEEESQDRTGQESLPTEPTGLAILNRKIK